MPRTILLADDSITIQKIVNLTFSSEGVDVVTVGNGDAALKKIHELRPDVVLADIFMPGKNGYEVCEYVKSEPELQSTPVILLVGAFEPFDSGEANRVKADGHLTKPFEIKVLISAVNSLISAAEERQEMVESPGPLSESAISESIAAEPAAEAASPESLPELNPAEPMPEPEGGRLAFPAADLTESATPGPLGVPLEDIEAPEPLAAEPAAEASAAVSTRFSAAQPQGNAGLEPVVLEESDPLGLFSADSGLEAAVDVFDTSVDARSLIVDIWEPKPSPAREVVAEPAEFPASSGPEAVEVGSAGATQIPEEITEPASGPEVPQEVPEAGTEESVVAESIPEPVATALPALSQPAAFLDSEEMIERIAARVVEKMSREVIEKIAWEVVPDLAELMIKEHVEAHFKASQHP